MRCLVVPGSRLAVLVLTLSVSAATLAAARLYPEAVSAWSAYVSVTEGRIQQELGSSSGFLGMDFGRDAASERRDVLGGAIVVRMMQSSDAKGRPMTAPSALIHHVRGAVLIPGVTVRHVLADLQAHAPEQEDILRASILERGQDRTRVYLRLQRKRFVTVIYDTEHTVTYAHFGDTRASSTSTATRITEVSNPGTPEERDLPPGDDRGFLWRLNSYWRYEEVSGGVIAECESLSLSRDVPSLVRYLVGPLVESTAKESMERTLATLRTRFAPT